jgi:transcriptional regulator with XRE-family HTH domain
MTPKGPQSPRISIITDRSNDALRVAAFQVGAVVSAARNRADLTQEQLAKDTGLTQRSISFIELGNPVTGVADTKIDALFRHLNLPINGRQTRFIKWWRDNGPTI